jgi:hypothetical protein
LDTRLHQAAGILCRESVKDEGLAGMHCDQGWGFDRLSHTIDLQLCAPSRQKEQLQIGVVVSTGCAIDTGVRNEPQRDQGGQTLQKRRQAIEFDITHIVRIANIFEFSIAHST